MNHRCRREMIPGVIGAFSMRPITSLEPLIGPLSLAATLMAGPAVLLNLAVGWVSIGLVGRVRSPLHRRARG